MRIYGNRDSFYQWDTNQKVVHNFKVGDEVHFFNMKQPTALTVRAYQLDNTVVAEVPNILLQSSYPIYVYWMYLDQNGQYTKEEFTFTVKQRPKPAGYVYTETEVLSYEYLDARINALEGEGLAAAVANYLKENPVEAGSKLTIGEVKLRASKWVGSGNLYSQVVTIDGVTPYSQIDLTPSVEQLAIFHDKDLAFVTENEDGVVTVYALGDKPANDYTMQVTIKEVSV